MLGRSGWRRFAAVWLVVVLAMASPGRLSGQTARGNGQSAPADATSLTKPALPAQPGLFTPPRLPTSPSLPRQPAPPVIIGLPQMVGSAGIIFSGQVLRVARKPTRGGFSLEAISITFHIDRALRGATTGKSLTIHEWAGAWSSGQRYRPGERVLLFLYPPSRLGLTSCVAGPVGRFRIDASGRVLLSDEHLAVFASDPILGGKSRVSLDDFAQAVRHAGGEERAQP
jgi:hypothetical protein